ncbi:MAG: hypothetical protein RCG15_00220 [Candidatus Rickettsia vulgarisii]
MQPNGGGTTTISGKIASNWSSNNGTVNTQGNVIFNNTLGSVGLELFGITFSNGNVVLNSTSNINTYTIGEAGANVTINGIATGNVNYISSGTFNINNTNLIGNVSFAYNSGNLNLTKGTIQGNVDGGNGNLNLFDDCVVTDNIGVSNPINIINMLSGKNFIVNETIINSNNLTFDPAGGTLMLTNPWCIF